MPTAVAVRRRRCCTGRMQDGDPRRRPPVTFDFPLLHLDGCNGDTGEARVAGGRGRGRAGGQAGRQNRTSGTLIVVSVISALIGVTLTYMLSQRTRMN